MTARWTRRAALLAAPGLALAARGAWAQEGTFPTRPVRIIVPFAAGGPTDVIVRIIAEQLGDRWKQPVVVENRGGGGTIVGTNALAQSTADGYTIGVATNSFVINPAVRQRLPYDTVRAFTAVGMLVTSPFVLVTSPGFAPRNLAELVAHAKEARSPLAYASPGPGTGGQMAGEMLQQKAGIQMEHVPYNGSAPALTDVLGDRVPLMFDLWSSVRPHAEAGRLKLMAVAGDAKLVDSPATPTIAETYPGFSVTAFQAMVAPAGVPEVALRRISTNLQEIVASSRFGAQVRPLGVEPAPSTITELDTFLKGELAKWRDVARAASISLD